MYDYEAVEVQIIFSFFMQVKIYKKYKNMFNTYGQMDKMEKKQVIYWLDCCISINFEYFWIRFGCVLDYIL